jgi:hypothetical protein
LTLLDSEDLAQYAEYSRLVDFFGNLAVLAESLEILPRILCILWNKSISLVLWNVLKSRDV